MAHMIDSLSYSGDVPWHGLGRKLPANVTGEDMIRFAGLDWEVIPRPLAAQMPGGALAPVPGHVRLPAVTAGRSYPSCRIATGSSRTARR